MAIKGEVTSAGAAANRRGTVRRKLMLAVPGERVDGAQSVVTLLNLSTSGALLRSAQALRVGERIRLALSESDETSAKVVWVSDDLYGCRFEKPISRAALAAASLRSAIFPPTFEPGGVSAPPSLPTFGARLQAERQRRGWSLSALAGRVGVSKPALWKWERDEVRPRPDALERLAAVLDLSPGELVYGPASSNPTLGPSTTGASVLDPIVDAARRQIAARLGLDPAAVELVVSLRI